MTYLVGVVQFPGSNCERETKIALERANLTPIDIFWFDDIKKLKQCDAFVIVGGFSFEDRSRSGVIAAHDAIMKALLHEAQTGKFILGICNGAQILVESGLVPGCINAENELQVVMALAHNRRIKHNEIIGTGFYNDWVYIKPANSAATQMIRIPVAHAEGRFLMLDNLYAELKKSNVALWQYVDSSGYVDPNFPINPNGSDQNLAAVGNFSGNILAIMPHPERTQHGDFIFNEMKQYIENQKQKSFQFKWIVKNSIRQVNINTREDHFTKKYFVKLMITDNEAVTVQMAFEKMGLNLNVQKYRFWGMNCDPMDCIKIESAHELWNAKKEKVFLHLPEKQNTQFILVTDLGDTVAEKKLSRLRNLHHATTLQNLKTGVVWQLTGSKEIISKAIDSAILFNTISQEFFYVQ